MKKNHVFEIDDEYIKILNHNIFEKKSSSPSNILLFFELDEV